MKRNLEILFSIIRLWRNLTDIFKKEQKDHKTRFVKYSFCIELGKILLKNNKTHRTGFGIFSFANNMVKDF